MSFESTRQALQTLVTYSNEVIALYEQKLESSPDTEVTAALDLALEHEQEHLDETEVELETLTHKLESAQFKWHDRELLLEAPTAIAQRPVESVDDVIALVATCDEPVVDYCDVLVRNTNSEAVHEFVAALRDRRQQSLKDFVRQAERGMQ